MTLLELNLERQRRQFLEEENKKLRAEIAVEQRVQRILVSQEEESGKCKNCVLCFIFMWSLGSTLVAPVGSQKSRWRHSCCNFFSYSDTDESQEIPSPTNSEQNINFACEIRNENLLFVVYLNKSVVVEIVPRQFN